MKSIATVLVVLSVFFIQETSGLPLRHLRSVDASASTSDKAGVQAIGLRKDDNAVNAGDALKHVANWISSEGGGASDGMLGKMTQHAGAEIRGVVASRNVDDKEYLLNLPKKLWLHLDNFPALRDTALPKAKCSSLDVSQSKIRLAAAIALESKRGPKAFYYEYLSGLPSRQDFKSFMPNFIEDGLKRNFTGLPLVAIAVELQRVDHNGNQPCFMEWKRMPESPVADLNWDDVHLALTQIRTRGYSVSGGRALIPGSDMLNTATASKINTVWGSDDEDGFQLQPTSHVAEGVELYDSYCTSCDNGDMLATWGVYLEDNEVEVDGWVDCKKHQNGTLRHSMESTLDMTKKSMALASDLRSPRCRQEVFSAEQGPLQCSLARLTWEYCADSWGLARKSMSFLQTGKVVTAPPLSPREKAMRVLRSSRGAWGGVPEKVTDARSS